MKLAIGIIISILWFLFLGNTRITLNPFSVSMEYWERAVGWILICLGIAILTIGAFRKGKTDGQNEVLDALNEYVEMRQKEELK